MNPPRSHTIPPRCHTRLLDEDTNLHDENTQRLHDVHILKPLEEIILKPPEWDAQKPLRRTTLKPPEWDALKPPKWTTQKPPRWDAQKPPRRTILKPLDQHDQKPPNTITNPPWNASEPPWMLAQLDQSDQNQPACLNVLKLPRWTTQKPPVALCNQLNSGKDLDDWILKVTNAVWEVQELSRLVSLLLKDASQDVLEILDATTQLLRRRTTALVARISQLFLEKAGSLMKFSDHVVN